MQQLPQLHRTTLGERVGDGEGAAQPQHILRRIGPANTVEAAFRRGGNEVLEGRLAHLCLLNILDMFFYNFGRSDLISSRLTAGTCPN